MTGVSESGNRAELGQACQGRLGLGLIASIGFFGLAAQALLFRAFLAVFEGSELGIACFFGSWLTWVAAGALVARSPWAPVVKLGAHFEFLPLLYIPAYLLQASLFGGVRELAGVRPYEIFPLIRMLPATFAINAPVSFCTGLLFTFGCRWLSGRPGLPVAKVYVWESAGSFAGAVLTTLLLSRGIAAEEIFLWAALPMTVAVACVRFGRRAWIAAAAPAGAVAALLFAGVPARWERSNDLAEWARLLPAETYRGSFTTPGARYRYGEQNGQFCVAAWETVTDTIPATEHASAVLAAHLSQNPGARRFLVVGRGAFALCSRLLSLPQADAVTWLDPDPDYPSRLLAVLPERYRPGAGRIEIPRAGIRRWLAYTTSSYDVVVLNLPDATTLALNGYFTREFMGLLKKRLATGGLVGVRVSAGENYMSGELVNAGASVYRTLRSVFARVVIKPGEESWLIASDGADLATAPAVLRDRYASIPGAKSLYPPDGLLSLYLPQRSADQEAAYMRAAAGAEGDLLLNTDRAPRALLHGLLFAAREAGGAQGLGRWIRNFALHGAPILPAGFLLALVVALLHARRTRGEGPSAGASYWLLFASGAAGMGGSVGLMYLYQAAFGSIFLLMGLLSALYMLGLAAGGSLAARWLDGRPDRVSRLLAAVIALHIALCGALALEGEGMRHALFVASFLVYGLLCGTYVPAAASLLNAADMASSAAGARVEALDHLGGAAGGLLVGLLLLPVFGSMYSFGVLCLLLATCSTVFAVRARGAATGSGRLRAAGTVLFGAVAFVLAAGLLLHRGGQGEGDRAFRSFARGAAGGNAPQERRCALPDGTLVEYFAIDETAPGSSVTNQLFAFSTERLAPEAVGYGGALALAALVESNGVLRDVAVLPSRETPAYLESLRPWFQRLRGHRLFEKDPLKDVDAVTGATLTSAAALRLLRAAGPAFAGHALGMEIGPGSETAPAARPRGAVVWLTVSAAAALALRRRPSRCARRVLLVLVVILSGFVFNAQYSLVHVFALLGLSVPQPGWSAGFLLAVCVPIVVALFGNVYCGYLCPFGALQELFGELRPAALRTDPDRRSWGRVRIAKYALLALLALVFGATLNASLASGDPLSMVFARERPMPVACLGVAVLLLAFLIPRFWCRAVCPAGAFLALLNGIRLLRRWVPAVAPAACRDGVTEEGELDCICCDGCRRPGRRERDIMQRPAGWVAPLRTRAVLWIAALAVAAAVAAQSIAAWRRDAAGETQRAAQRGGWGARAADIERIRSRIRQGTLSGHEALYYRRAPDAGNP